MTIPTAFRPIHPDTSAIALLKGECPQGKRLTLLLSQLFADKGISAPAIQYLSNQPFFLTHLIGHLLMQAPEPLQIDHHELLNTHLEPLYTGSKAENREIDEAISHSQIHAPEQGMRKTTWAGAAGAYYGGGLSVPEEMRDVGVVIIGGGAGGIFVTRALANAGMRNILMLEKDGCPGGIWGKDMPRRILQAVPFPLHFEQMTLEKGPRLGQEITELLATLVSPSPKLHWPAFPRVIAGEVTEILPGDLRHRVLYRDYWGRACEIEAPIVINAPGTGEPLIPSWSEALSTDLTPEQTGKRWQEVWSEEESQALAGRKLGFIGLSNATLSMLWQIQALQREGMEIDYEVITHYPAASVFEPQARIEHRGRVFQLSRNVESCRLLRYAEDMAPFRRAFEEAREKGRITTQVTHWTLEHQGPERFIKAFLDTGEQRLLPCDQLYTLIGYGPRAKTLTHMGLRVSHPHLGAAYLDFDGEAQREPNTTGRGRTFPGYYCIGLRNHFNDNEVLLPGLLYRLPNVVAGVLLRSAEYVARDRQSSEMPSRTSREEYPDAFHPWL